MEKELGPILEHLSLSLSLNPSFLCYEVPPEEMKLCWILILFKTTPHRATGESSFNLCFRVEAMTPAEVGVKSLRNEAFNEDLNNQLMEKNLVLLDEIRVKQHKETCSTKELL
ncbi:hypothetical protein M9H77_12833 [Catharanthus roseus]|uniref:Uncharacterized protein n=1 Tax=Catharanthus roseus TaxID=4058 RepID=A0ACC0BIF9_CATRO|nr:hypothetical protein M9H77_12833 [Catharanthus roseus]